MIASIKSYCENLEKSFSEISPERKILLNALADYILTKQQSNQPVNLVYICTHNSRRSHFGQIWSQVAANYYNIKNIATFSGGTETTAFNINAINAIKRIGFEVHEKSENKNPIYHLIFDKNQKPIEDYPHSS